MDSSSNFFCCAPNKAEYLWPTNACLQVTRRKYIDTHTVKVGRTYLVVHKTECRQESQGRSK